MLILALKFFIEKILPSVLATVTAAYIVNHYITDRPADAPIKAAASAAMPDKAGSNNFEVGVRAKGVSEKAVAKKVEAEEVRSETTAARPAEKRTETASQPTDAKKHQTVRREKTAKATSTPNAQAQAVVAAPDAHRDANDLARAAIDRLRGVSDAPSRVEASHRQSEVSRPGQDADRQPAESISSHPQEVTRATPQPAVYPLPPAIQVSTPAIETPRLDEATGMEEESHADSADRARLPVPPADIPRASRPLDLEANTAAPVMRAHTTVADDMLSAAKSVFQTMLPR